MENASKVLLIAAAVLIVIILISFGMIMLNSTQDTVEDAQGVGSSISDASQTALGKIQASFNKGETTEPTQELISTETSYIGYYADIDGNGSVDGIIYADLAVEPSGKSWGGGTYSWTQKTELNNYYISQESYKHGNFEAKPVIAPIDKVEGNNRFYVMTLEDLNVEGKTKFYWYRSAYGRLNVTSTEFGKGKDNTDKMILKWNNKNFGSQDSQDMWKHIGEKVLEGWFVPSKEEWAAFAKELKISKANCESYGLSKTFWTSSRCDTYSVWVVCVNQTNINNYNILNSTCCVRLSRTF